MTIVITVATLKWAGLVLFILSLVAFLAGDAFVLGSGTGSRFGNALRWVVWPLMGVWLI